MRAEVTGWKEKADSDIRALKEGRKEAAASLADIKAEELERLRAKHARWVGAAGKIAIGIVLMLAGWAGRELVAVIGKGLH
jgi:hypothetical protein